MCKSGLKGGLHCLYVYIFFPTIVKHSSPSVNTGSKCNLIDLSRNVMLIVSLLNWSKAYSIPIQKKRISSSHTSTQPVSSYLWSREHAPGRRYYLCEGSPHPQHKKPHSFARNPSFSLMDNESLEKGVWEGVVRVKNEKMWAAGGGKIYKISIMSRPWFGN